MKLVPPTSPASWDPSVQPHISVPGGGGTTQRRRRHSGSMARAREISGDLWRSREVTELDGPPHGCSLMLEAPDASRSDGCAPGGAYGATHVPSGACICEFSLLTHPSTNTTARKHACYFRRLNERMEICVTTGHACGLRCAAWLRAPPRARLEACIGSRE